MAKYLVGVDLGTSLVKTAIYDTESNCVAEAFQESQLRCPEPGCAEQEPEDFYRSTVKTVAQAAQKARIRPGDVVALGIDSQAGGIMGIDADWRPVTSYDSPLDTKCLPYCARMSRHAKDIIRIAGAFPTYGQKILWWKHEKPEAWKRIHKFIHPAAFVAGRLTSLKADSAYMDRTFLCWSGFADTQRERWSQDLCDLFDISVDKLPLILAPEAVVGGLTPSAARECGLLAGTPVVAGLGDGMAGLLGAGLVEHGMAAEVSGTANYLAVCVDRYVTDTQNQTLCCSASAVKDLYCINSFLLAGRTHRWFVDEFCQEERKMAERAGLSEREATDRIFESLDSRAEKIPPGSARVICIPQCGGRMYPSDPEVRGLWIGFGWGHHKEHLYRSILEAAAYEYFAHVRLLREKLPQLRIREVRALGGGARSRLWTHIKADVLAIPFVRLEREDLATFGTALVAGYGVGIYADLVQTAKRFARLRKEVCEPKPGLQDVYRPYAEFYWRLYSALKPLYHELAGIPVPSSPTENLQG